MTTNERFDDTAAHLNGHGDGSQDFFACGAELDERTSMKRDAALTADRDGDRKGDEVSRFLVEGAFLGRLGDHNTACE